MALALAALGYSINSEDQGEIDEAKQLLIDVKPNVDTINSTFIERATRGEIDFGMGWNGDIRRAIVGLAKKDREMVFLVPEGPTEYWVDNWVHPGRRPSTPSPRTSGSTSCSSPAAAGREMNYHQYPVPVEGITGVDEDLAERPGDQHLRRPDRGLRVPDRDARRACSSATGSTRSSRPPGHGGRRRDVRAAPAAARPAARSSAR